VSTHSIVIEGTTLPGVDLATAVRDLAKLTRTTEEAATQLLGGKPRTVKSGLDAATAERYVTALRNIGVASRSAPETLELDLESTVAQPAAAAPVPKKVSHAAGWIALAALVFANFTPAILAPILVLAALIFAARELSGGSKAFGSLVLALSLLQSWFVIDHFGHLSGSLGLVTAEEATKQAAAKYSAASGDLPGNWRETARSKCQEEWPTDYRMQQYCIEQQTTGAAALGEAPADIDATALNVIRGKCAEEWPRDFKMRTYCQNQQFDGYRALHASAASTSTRNACAQQWPADYKMRRYCETKGR
jgi:hypothetical protein